MIFSKTLKGSSSSFSTKYGGAGDQDPVSVAIEEALSNLKNDKKLAKLFKSSYGNSDDGGNISVEFTPLPDNSDIEINGVFYGNSPMTVNLPTGSTLKVKISKPGYENWEKSLMPREGMKIRPELAKKTME